MKSSSIFTTTIILLLVFSLVWSSTTKPSKIKYNIENFLVIHNYIKRSFYKMVALFMDPKKSIHDMKVNIEEVDTSLIDISKKFTKAMGKYVRGDGIFLQMKRNIHTNQIDLFLFPDTLIQSTQIDYYKAMIERVHVIFDKKLPLNEFDNYKVLLESMVWGGKYESFDKFNSRVGTSSVFNWSFTLRRYFS